MTDEPDPELVDLIARAYLRGKDVESPNRGQRRAAQSVGEQLAKQYSDD